MVRRVNERERGTSMEINYILSHRSDDRRERIERRVDMSIPWKTEADGTELPQGLVKRGDEMFNG